MKWPNNIGAWSQSGFLVGLRTIFALVLCSIFSVVSYGYAQQCTQPPPPAGPGGDQPDDTFAVDNGNPPISYILQSPNLTTLMEGFFNATSSLSSSLRNGSVYTDINSASSDLLSASKLLIIPSGGLYGLENSAFLKASLDEYVKNGGTLVILAQQHGYEFSILPVPQEEHRDTEGHRVKSSLFTSEALITERGQAATCR
jgi:hypothetical protein